MIMFRVSCGLFLFSVVPIYREIDRRRSSLAKGGTKYIFRRVVCIFKERMSLNEAERIGIFNVPRGTWPRTLGDYFAAKRG